MTTNKTKLWLATTAAFALSCAFLFFMVFNYHSEHFDPLLASKRIFLSVGTALLIAALTYKTLAYLRYKKKYK